MYVRSSIVAVVKSNQNDGPLLFAEAATYASRRRGRQRLTWKDGLENDLTSLSRQGRDREKWRMELQTLPLPSWGYSATAVLMYLWMCSSQTSFVTG